MKLLLLSRDLVFQARTEGAARNLGVTMSVVGNLNVAVELATDSDCRGIVVDLQLPGLQVGDLVEEIRSVRSDSIQIVACGPHVHEKSLNAAREAGCDVVATRGQFDRDAEEILRRCTAEAER